MRNFPFNLRRLLFAISTLRSRAKRLLNTGRLASLRKTLSRKRIENGKGEWSLHSSIIKRVKNRLPPSYLSFKPPVLTEPRSLPLITSKKSSPRPSTIRNLAPTIKSKPKYARRREANPIVKLPEIEKDIDFLIEKVKIAKENDHLGKPTLTRKDFPSPRNFPSILERNEDALNAFLISLKRKLGG